jgi:hypothetical protein
MKDMKGSWGKGYAKEHTKVLPGKNSAAAAPSMGTKKTAGKKGSAEPCMGCSDCPCGS